jgi:hypothetical protein
MATVVRIRPGESDAIAAGLNPLEPAADGAGRRFPLQTHADLVKALFIASFRSDEPFPQVLSAALTRVYEDAGWDLALGEPVAADANPGYPNLTDLQPAGSSRAGTSSTSAPCSMATPCWRSRTSVTTATRRSSWGRC